MASALQVLVVNGPQVVGIWLVLLVMAGAALAGLAAPQGAHDPRQLRAWLLELIRQRRADAARRAEEAAEAIRYADEIAVATRRAAATAERRRDQWSETQRDVDVAWGAYRQAEATLARAGRAAAYAAPVTSRTPAEYAHREQFLHRTATAACRHGDLSIEQLSDVLANRAGWDPRLHPVEQELRLARATADYRLAAYRRASAAERDAWRVADVAAAALRALRQETATATGDAVRLTELSPAARRRPARKSAGRPRLVTP